MALALSTRLPTIAAVGSMLAAMALAAAVAGRSCRVTQPGPEVAVRDMIQAAKTADRDAVFDLLSPATRTRLDAAAKHATEVVGASTRYTAKDLISIGSTDATASPTDITVIDEVNDHASVEVVSPAGRSRMELVKVAGRWLIDLPTFGR